MRASPPDIENIPGFVDWFMDARAAPRGEPSTVVELHGMGCTFSRSLTEEERATILGFLHEHAEKHTRYGSAGWSRRGTPKS